MWMQVWEYFTGLYGENRLEMVALALTRPPMPTCFRVNTLVISPQVTPGDSSHNMVLSDHAKLGLLVGQPLHKNM